jgi:transcriptional regulator GlxA family with amidase domain
MDDGQSPVGRWKDEIAWIGDQYNRGAIVCSVCTGSMMLAEAGLLDDVDATNIGARCRPSRIAIPA